MVKLEYGPNSMRLQGKKREVIEILAAIVAVAPNATLAEFLRDRQ